MRELKAKALLLAAIILAAVFAMFGSAAAVHKMQRCLVTPVDNIEARPTAYHITMMSTETPLEPGDEVMITFGWSNAVNPATTAIVISESDKFKLDEVGTNYINITAKDHVSAQEQVTLLVTGVNNPPTAGTYGVSILWYNGTAAETGVAYVEITKPSYVGSTLGNIVGDVVYLADTFVSALAGTDIGMDLADLLAEVVDVVEDLVKALP